MRALSRRPSVDIDVEGMARQQWGKLTEDHLTQIEGKRDELVGRLQERYVVAKDDADKQIKDWESRLSKPRSSVPDETAGTSPAVVASAPADQSGA